MGLAPDNYTYSFGTDFVENLNVYGKLTGNLTGNVTGNLTGDVTGNLTGDVTGNLTGDVNAGIVTATSFEGDGSALTGIVSIPAGAVFYFASSSAPTGYLKANGDTVPNGSGTVQGVTADFSALYAILGSTYGSAGKLPDLRGEFIRGWDDGRGADSGRSFGSFQSWAIQNITGSIARIAETFIQASFSATSALYKSSNSPNSGLTPNQPDTSASGTLAFDASRNVQTANETRPRNVALLACIKY